MHNAPRFARVGGGSFIYTAFTLLFAERLFPWLKPMSFGHKGATLPYHYITIKQDLLQDEFLTNWKQFPKLSSCLKLHITIISPDTSNHGWQIFQLQSKIEHDQNNLMLNQIIETPNHIMQIIDKSCHNINSGKNKIYGTSMPIIHDNFALK